ncbi:hypothetical protein ACNKHL_07975 [Shigella flexneri]
MDITWHTAADIIWDNFHEKCTDSWCWRSMARHVINQLADGNSLNKLSAPWPQNRQKTPIQLIKCKQLPAKKVMQDR